jgi:hypothetical protein
MRGLAYLLNSTWELVSYSTSDRAQIIAYCMRKSEINDCRLINNMMLSGESAVKWKRHA